MRVWSREAEESKQTSISSGQSIRVKKQMRAGTTISHHRLLVIQQEGESFEEKRRR
jgi:uncharacterized protein (UPF0248 family)